MGAFNTISRWNKAWILLTGVSLMLYDLYWIRGVYNWIYERLLENLPNITVNYPTFYTDFVAGGVADTLRSIAVISLFVVAFLAWGPKKRPFTAVRKYLAVAVFFEAIYWLAILPYNILNIATGKIPQLLFVGCVIQTLGVGFVIQILAAAPLLTILSTKIWRYKSGERNNLITWGYIAGIGYIFGTWINNMLRWFSMSGQAGLADLFTGITTLGFLNTAVTLTLSIAFAIAGSFVAIKGNNRKLSVQLLGLAILLFGVNFAFYVIYSWFAPNAWRFVLLTEIWPVPLIGLGIGMIKGKI
jgi:hypothetical protein